LVLFTRVKEASEEVNGMDSPFRLPQNDPCLFCEAVDGNIEKGIVEQVDLTLTLVNGRQFSPGQIIVIPRRHAPTLFDLTDTEASAITTSVRRVAVAIERAYDPDGMLLYQNNGIVSGQEIPHFHMHVVPLYEASSTWNNGPPHIAAIEGWNFRMPEGNIEVTAAQEREIASIIRGHLEPLRE
jgi:diadenosine tetraphosphate (Ap4A) HIT family hydrolase